MSPCKAVIWGIYGAYLGVYESVSRVQGLEFRLDVCPMRRQSLKIAKAGRKSYVTGEP